LFPHWKQVLPAINAKWTVVKLSPAAITQLLQVIPKLPCEEGSTYPVRLRIVEKCLWIEGRDKKDADWTKVAVSDVTITGKSKTIVLKRNYLVQALKFGFDEFAVEAENKPLALPNAQKAKLQELAGLLDVLQIHKTLNGTNSTATDTDLTTLNTTTGAETSERAGIPACQLSCKES